LSDTWLLYEGVREGNHSVNSRVSRDKYTVTRGLPFKVVKDDLWIASLPGYTVLSQVDFVPTTIRQPSPDESYLTRWEAALLEGLAASLPDPARVVEIGTGKGVSIARLLLGLTLHTDVLVYTIDLKECIGAGEHIEKCQIPNWRYKFLVGDSVAIGKEWNESLDMLYLDGNHSYEGVIADIEAWYPYLKAGGILSFHDYGNKRHQVTRAVDSAMKNCEVKRVARVGYLIVYERVS